MKEYKRKKLMMVVAMIIFGTLGPLTRQIAVTSGELALYRAILAAILIICYIAVTGQKIGLRGNKKEVLLLLMAGMALGCDWMLLFQSYRYTTIAVATLCLGCAPVVMTALCPFLFHEKLTARQALCLAMSTVGVVLIVGMGSLPQTADSTNRLGMIYGLGAAFFCVISILLNKCIKNVTGIHSTLIEFIGVILILGPYVMCTSGIHLENLDSVSWLCLLVVGLFHTGVTYCIYFSAIKGMKGSDIAILGYLDPVVAILISWFILGESMSMSQLLGGALILGFAWWSERGGTSE